MKNFFLLFMMSVFLLGCSSTVVTPIMKKTDNSYVISAEGVRDDSSAADRMAQIKKAADDFCKQEKKIVEILTVNEYPGGFGKVPATGMTFRCVNVQ